MDCDFCKYTPFVVIAMIAVILSYNMGFVNGERAGRLEILQPTKQGSE